MASWHQKCYQLLSQIPSGKVSTYKIIAQNLGIKSYRAVGQVIAKNPNIPAVPCHRIVKSDGKISGYALGVEKKIALLKSEGIDVKDGKIVNFDQLIYWF